MGDAGSGVPIGIEDVADAAASRIDYRGMSVGEARRSLSARLGEMGKRDAVSDARLLVAHAARLDPSRLPLEAHRRLGENEAALLGALEAGRASGRSAYRLIGRRPFHEIELVVGEGVLEPRDDSTALVDLALPFLTEHCEREGKARVWDIGIGSGTIALALLAAESRASALGTDPSLAALACTRANAARLGIGLERLALHHGSFEDWPGEDGTGEDMGTAFELIVSNPPYIPSGEIEGLEPELRHDPREALDGGPDGLGFYRLFAASLAERLRPGGMLAIEIGAGQAPGVRALFAKQGWRESGGRRDLGGHERALAFTRAGEGE